MKIRLEIDRVAYKSKIYLDDVDISAYTRDVIVHVGVGHPSSCNITLIPQSMEIVGEITDLEFAEDTIVSISENGREMWGTKIVKIPTPPTPAQWWEGLEEQGAGT